MKVLLVEDEPALADVMARRLRVRGHDVAIRGSAEDAFLSLSEDWPEALIVDVSLSGEHSGWEILRQMSEQDRGRVKVVVTSAAPISSKRVSEFRPAHVLQKPFPIDALIRALEDEAIDESVPSGGAPAPDAITLA